MQSGYYICIEQLDFAKMLKIYHIEIALSANNNHAITTLDPKERRVWFLTTKELEKHFKYVGEGEPLVD